MVVEISGFVVEISGVEVVSIFSGGITPASEVVEIKGLVGPIFSGEMQKLEKES